KRLEPFAESHPRAYFARVVLLAMLGYAVWSFILLFLVGILISVGVLMALYPITLQFDLVIGALVLLALSAVLRGLWVTIEPPQGFEVHRSHAPELFAMLDGLSAELRAPRFHRVLLTGEYNASVVQVPRLGAFGWQRNFLILGLP